MKLSYVLATAALLGSAALLSAGPSTQFPSRPATPAKTSATVVATPAAASVASATCATCACCKKTT